MERKSEIERVTVADRDLGIAISAFAPGAVVVKDGAEHLCVGFTAYEYRSDRAFPRNPMAGQLEVQRCHECGSLETFPERTALRCRVCDAEVDRYMLYQPEGYRTRQRPGGWWTSDLAWFTRCDQRVMLNAR